MSAVTAEGIKERILRVREETSAALERGGRSGERVRLLVASKYYGLEQISALRKAGANLLGENRAEDLIEKQEVFGGDFEWHFIGHLQSRKAKLVAPRVSLIHSVDSLKLIKELEKRAPKGGADVLLQVNLSGEASKYGVSAGEVEKLLEAAAKTEGKVRVRGLMTLAPAVEAAENVRYVFTRLKEVRESLRQSWRPHFDLSELSMGMSSDYAVAVEEGATIIRIGRTLLEEDGSVRRQV